MTWDVVCTARVICAKKIISHEVEIWPLILLLFQISLAISVVVHLSMQPFD